MALELNSTNVAAVYNTLYPDGIEEMILPASPMLGLIGKDISAWDGLAGNGKQLLWEIGMGTGASGSYAEAVAQYGAETFMKPTVTRGRIFASRQIQFEDWEASKGNKGAAVDLVRQASKGAIRELKHRVSTLFGGGAGGTIGKIATTANVGTATVALENTGQIINFKPNQRLQLIDPATMTLRSGGAALTVTATGVNFEAGTLTFTGNVTAAVAAAVAGDLIIPYGDQGQVPTTMDAWNPRTLIAVGASDSFFGVDRGGSVAMQGYRWTPSAGSVDEILVQASAKHNAIGGEHDTALVNPLDMATIALNQFKATTRNAIGSTGKEIATVSYDGIIIKGAQGDIHVFSDPFRPKGYPRLCKLGSWKIWSLGKMFDRLTAGMGADGMLRVSGANAGQMIFGGYWQLVCERPLDNMIITLPGASVAG